MRLETPRVLSRLNWTADIQWESSAPNLYASNFQGTICLSILRLLRFRRAFQRQINFHQVVIRGKKDFSYSDGNVAAHPNHSNDGRPLSSTVDGSESHGRWVDAGFDTSIVFLC
jgi:hypothetical protein